MSHDQRELIRELFECLAEARRLNNKTVRMQPEVDAWHKKADRLLSEYVYDDRTQRFDDPKRVEHRIFVERLYR